MRSRRADGEPRALNHALPSGPRVAPATRYSPAATLVVRRSGAIGGKGLARPGVRLTLTHAPPSGSATSSSTDAPSSRCTTSAARAGTLSASAGATARLRRVISPRVDRLLEHVDSPYASVIVAAKRARQINSYYHNLGEGTFEEFPPPMVDTASKNYLTIALEEVATGKVAYRYR